MHSPREIVWDNKAETCRDEKTRSFKVSIQVRFILWFAMCVDNVGMELSFDKDMEYVFEPSNDPNYMKVYDRFGDAVECDIKRFTKRRDVIITPVVGTITYARLIRRVGAAGKAAYLMEELNKGNRGTEILGMYLYNDAKRIMENDELPKVFDEVEVEGKVHRFEYVEFNEEWQ